MSVLALLPQVLQTLMCILFGFVPMVLLTLLHDYVLSPPTVCVCVVTEL